MGTVIQMYASAVPGNAMAAIDVPHDGKLIEVDFSILVAAAGADWFSLVQLSFGSVIQDTINDTRSVISNVRNAGDITTTGGLVTFDNKVVPLPSLPVGMGERIYLHGSGTAVAITVQACLHFDFELDRALIRRR